MTGGTALASLLLGTATPTPIPTPVPEPIDPGRGGFLAVAMILFLAVAVVLLYRSMRTQMRRVSDDLPSDEDVAGRDSAGPPDEAPPSDPSRG